MLIKDNLNKSKTVVDALIKQFRKLPKVVCKPAQWDRGGEVPGHKDFTAGADIKIFVFDPSARWQKGLNETTNRLLRRYFPEGADISISIRKAA